MSLIKVTLPDNSIRELSRPSSVAEVAALIGPGLAKSAVGGKINDELVDIRTIIDKNAKLEIITMQNPLANEIIRHSAAHIMAQAIQEIWPDVKITIGPVIENGFFYDLDSPRNFVPEDLEKIEKQMQKIVEHDFEIKKEVWPIQKAIDTFKKMGETFKVEIIEDLARGSDGKPVQKEVSIYHQGPWFDLCRGPHVPRTSYLKAFKLMSIAGAYWRGDEKNRMLQRIYGTAFANKKDLDQYLAQLEEAKKRDHRKIGKERDLFMFHPWAPASPFFLPKGTVIYNELLKFMRELYFDSGYSEVVTPQVLDVELFKCSGHYDNYRDNMYFTTPADLEASKSGHESQSMLKAMNCPAHALMFGATHHSYRDLPLRFADFGRLHRYERAGVVHGLARVRTFSQDDAHIFCTLDQVQDEITSFMTLLNKVYATLGFTKYSVLFSTRPAKRMGEDSLWDKAESGLETALKNLKLEYKINAGDGAFYGPKLDIMVTDAIGRAWQLGTLQMDFNLANRFNLEYVGEDNKPHKPVVLHRAIFGSFERFIGVFIENCEGKFPTWIAPEQVRFITISESHNAYAEKISARLREHGVRSEVDTRYEKLGFKIREAQLAQIPYMLIVGEQEMVNNKLSVRLRGGKELKEQNIDDVSKTILEDIETRALQSPYLNV